SIAAFKRGAVRCGVANELYAYGQNWVEMDGDGKCAKAIEDPQAAYVRRYGKPGASALAPTNGNAAIAATVPVSILTDIEIVSCPKCGGRMWDNRLTKRNPRAHDYKCQNRSCDGVVWPPKAGATADAPVREQKTGAATDSVLIGSEEELPF